MKIRILDNPDKIAPIGMNITLRQSKGGIIIGVDGHTVIAPDYIFVSQGCRAFLGNGS